MKTKEYCITQVVANIICTVFTIGALFPFVLLVIGSFTDNTYAMTNGFSFFPKKWSTEAYEFILTKWGMIGHGYLMTIIVTVLGTVLSLIVSSLFAYGISQQDIKGMKIISFLLIFTMLFNGGLVSTYYSYINFFHIKNTVWALIIPNYLMNAFNVILIKNYFINSVPPSLREASRIDGAGEFKVFFSIIMPLSKPIIATVGLLTALTYWNDWVNGLYFLTQRKGSNLYTIQNILNNINENIQALLQNAGDASKIGASVTDLPSTTVRMAIAVVGILPIIVMYPFFQRYFVKGITLGGVKE
jgi:ABC-type sugar transport system, permease component